MAFVDEVLGGPTATTDPRGLTWLPVFERSGSGGPDVTVYVVLDDHPADHVGIGVGASVAASDGVASLRTRIPLFRAAKTGHPPASSPVVLGTPDGTMSLDVLVTVDDPLLHALQLVADVPTNGDAPTLGLDLQGLQLPGDPAPHDLSLSVHDLAELESTVLQLVLSLVKAGVAAAASGPLAALAGLLGLRDGGSVPPLPVADLVARGVPALTAWFEELLRGDATRAAWLAELSALFAPLGGTADTEAVSSGSAPPGSGSAFTSHPDPGDTRSSSRSSVPRSARPAATLSRPCRRTWPRSTWEPPAALAPCRAARPALYSANAPTGTAPHCSPAIRRRPAGVRLRARRHPATGARARR